MIFVELNVMFFLGNMILFRVKHNNFRMKRGKGAITFIY